MCPKDVHEIANSVDPDQTAPLGAVWSGSALFAQTYLSKNLGTIQYYTSGWGPYCCGESSASLSLAILYHGSDFKSQLVAHTGKPIFAYEWLVFFCAELLLSQSAHVIQEKPSWKGKVMHQSVVM